ncbi:carbohydrate kinase family protein [Brevibacillus nitrificans]|uniref:carbohydrate kinase family protein n=1 Tax=Brevibacillus nitrificans TaxID=651560 RepID=UPI00262D02B3|nr:carbohydrate kinase family protein [Brevibacillus nitrificans]
MLEGMKDYWLCVGGANVDMQGVTSVRLLPGTSNPGVVHQTAGGVARNVAESLGWLGEEVHLYALVGEDSDGEWLRQITADSGVATHGMFRVPGRSTGRYLAICDLDEELYTAVADMAINDAWNAAMIQSGLLSLQQAAGLFMDANLPLSVMEAFLTEANRLEKKVIVDLVSVKKAEKWKGLLAGIYTIVGSIDEMETLCGQILHSYQDVEKCAKTLVDEGVSQVMIMCGEAGLYLCNQTESFWLSLPDAPIRASAGDAFAAGVIYAQNKTQRLVEQGAFGMAMAELSMERKGNIDLNVLSRRAEFFVTKPNPRINGNLE